MSNYERQQRERNETKDRDKTRKEKLAGYFFNLSQLTYTALVLGGMVLFFSGEEISWPLVSMLVAGCVIAYSWAKFANNILK